MEIKWNFSWSWDWRDGEGAEISGRNSTLDVEEGEGDKGEKSENKRGETGGKGEAWIGESGGKGEDRRDTGSYLEGEGNLSSDMEI